MIICIRFIYLICNILSKWLKWFLWMMRRLRIVCDFWLGRWLMLWFFLILLWLIWNLFNGCWKLRVKVLLMVLIIWLRILRKVVFWWLMSWYLRLVRILWLLKVWLFLKMSWCSLFNISCWFLRLVWNYWLWFYFVLINFMLWICSWRIYWFVLWLSKVIWFFLFFGVIWRKSRVIWNGMIIWSMVWLLCCMLFRKFVRLSRLMCLVFVWVGWFWCWC